MFDPEKVERMSGEHLLTVMQSGNRNLKLAEWVRADEFDKLLKLLRMYRRNASFTERLRIESGQADAALSAMLEAPQPGGMGARGDNR